VRILPVELGVKPSEVVVRRTAVLAGHLLRACDHLEVVEVCCAAGDDEIVWRDGLEEIRDDVRVRGEGQSWWDRLKVVGVPGSGRDREQWDWARSCAAN
jgi:hypothetical protein